MIETRMRLDKKKFGKFIATRRESIKGIETQELLAEKIHVTSGYIGKLEAGGGLPSFELFVDLADALLMTPGELMMELAEREDPGRNYMEMNDWLFERLKTLINEYQLKVSNIHHPPLHNPIPTGPTQLAEVAEADRLAYGDNDKGNTTENINQELNSDTTKEQD
jgi:transcriptional regulator with XRE-family HTH domain